MNAVAVLELRAWARAELYAACVYDLRKAVDKLQRDAKRSGLVAGLGQDAVQRILADAFHEVRSADATGWKAVAAMAWNAPGWQALGA
jgi:hypothetical protein